jgi:hypothetical protein
VRRRMSFDAVIAVSDAEKARMKQQEKGEAIEEAATLGNWENFNTAATSSSTVVSDEANPTRTQNVSVAEAYFDCRRIIVAKLLGGQWTIETADSVHHGNCITVPRVTGNVIRTRCEDNIRSSTSGMPIKKMKETALANGLRALVKSAIEQLST